MARANSRGRVRSRIADVMAPLEPNGNRRPGYAVAGASGLASMKLASGGALAALSASSIVRSWTCRKLRTRSQWQPRRE
jgi:hypothetical protein